MSKIHRPIEVRLILRLLMEENPFIFCNNRKSAISERLSVLKKLPTQKMCRPEKFAAQGSTLTRLLVNPFLIMTFWEMMCLPQSRDSSFSPSIALLAMHTWSILLTKDS